MSNPDQPEPNQQTAAGGPQQPEDVPLSGYGVVSTSGRAADEIYAFRQVFNQPQPELAVQPQRTKPNLMSILLLAAAAVACVLLLVIGIPLLMKPKPPALYIDLGNRRFDPAGLAGRLIARWQGSAAYQLSIDPLDQPQLDGFRAVALDPPYPLSVVIRLRDAAGLVACQKEILLPAPQLPSDSGHAQAPPPASTQSGDTVQYVAGEDGKIAEIAVAGPLPCPQDAYRRITGWDFTSNFPTLAGQDERLRHENALDAARKPHPVSGPALWGGVVQHLSAPIEGDDVIIGDNPLRGTVDTSDGRVFFVIKSGAKNRAPEWQLFPAAIHFRCDKNGFCILTHTNTRSTLQARLLK